MENTSAEIITNIKRAYYKQYRELNKQKLNAYQRDYRAKNKSKVQQYNKNYWLKKSTLKEVG